MINNTLIMDEENYIEKIKSLENQLDSYKKHIDKLEKEFNAKIEKQNKMLNSQNELFEVIFCDTDFKAQGHLRNVQLQTLEILRFVVKICEENNLDYWLDYGSLIGGIRHKGFVPWDDEADICIPRPDYEKFLVLAREKINEVPNLKENLRVSMGVSVFRNMNNPDFPSLSCQVICSKPLANVDVHPIDFYKVTPENEEELLKNNSKRYILNAKSKIISKVKDGTYESFNEAYLAEGEKIGITYDETDYLGSCADGTGRKPIHKKYIYPLKRVEFEGYEFNIPNNPEKYLSKYYSGSVMKIPPVIQNHSRTDWVKARIPQNELEETYEKIINYMKFVNSNY